MIRERVRELLPILQAYAEGKEIQYKMDDVWFTCEASENINFVDDIEYRIKPEENYTIEREVEK